MSSHGRVQHGNSIMSSFSPAQRAALCNEFWRRESLHCHLDRCALRIHFYPSAGGYLLVLACTHCAAKAQVTRYSDPRRASFRPWTFAEKHRLAAAGFQRNAECPVCQTLIHHQAAARNEIFVLECQRCGNVHEATTSDHPMAGHPANYSHELSPAAM